MFLKRLFDILARIADCGHHGKDQDARRACVLLPEARG